MGKNNQDPATDDVKDLQLEQFKELVAAQDEVIETLKESVNELQTKLEEVTGNLKDLNTKVDNAPVASTDGKPKKRVLKDPGEVTIAGAKYTFLDLAFRIQTDKGLETIIAEDAAKDKQLLAWLLENHPSVFKKA
mgnify:CR=1 FL=1